ncbi:MULTISPECIES: Rieske (2Fe-2S) protein [Streptomyces]|uniref:Cytochrome bc1 complex Rieske iron-sulfur subunit n=4 Tax=Streptomyces TaxID=1883 RepID=A0A8H9HU95_9ACTN|nr:MULTISPECIES: Rieske (2Fe-2S) protein [Streptomyces]MBL3807326.1 Rieske (2Fe-2S) protein [Streptomyces sp. BRB081]MDQ0296137.1 nitrite reductase/ring-hydroxylating ferredoxin subunit [Streptomyces sp. DSM 41037]PJM85498.1 FeS-binding protein [Streptomyces sp. TSRI0384-2]QNE80646.1 Rieske 2Fe-2S domain-containing protein [Streptomyces rutgersensis]RPK93416.1 Cytochrome b6-f complex iron-sulfur subunit [Streptomyces sp. ADI98-12]
MSAHPLSRRTVLRGAALVPAAGLGAAACAAPDDGRAEGPAEPVELGAADAVEKGGAEIFREHHVVVSRSEEGEYRAFSAVCTHRQCPLHKIKGTVSTCTCHGSRFDVTTGEVLEGPAVAPLTELDVSTDGGRLVARPRPA